MQNQLERDLLKVNGRAGRWKDSTRIMTGETFPWLMNVNCRMINEMSMRTYRLRDRNRSSGSLLYR